MKKKLLMSLLCVSLALGMMACGQEEPVQGESVTEVSEEETAGKAEETETTDSGAEESASESEAEEAKAVPILKDAVMEKVGCRIGCAATASELQDPKVWEIITTHFNAITFGNELKPDCLFDYSNGRVPGIEEAELNGEIIQVPKIGYSRVTKMLDKVLEWNEQNPDNQIKVRGHVLVWHAQTPEWFFHEDYDKTKDYVDKETMDKRLEWYIKTVLTHFTGPDSKYKDMFYGWDVVNEAVSDGGGIRTDHENPSESLSQDTHGSNSSWYHIYQSDEYIINAFKYANKYAPADLELYYNDYNECTHPKMNSIAELLTKIKENEGEPGVGTRISGMGMQGHYDMSNPGMDRIELAATTYGKIVGNVQLTELDLKARDSYDGSEESKKEEYEKQASRYRIIYLMMENTGKKEGINLTGITFWGTVDHYSWLQSRSNVGGGSTTGLKQCPLLFDENYEPKPCFYVFAENKK